VAAEILSEGIDDQRPTPSVRLNPSSHPFSSVLQLTVNGKLLTAVAETPLRETSAWGK
jgi:hypothetical protein